jgi:hypothetical protein
VGSAQGALWEQGAPQLYQGLNMRYGSHSRQQAALVHPGKCRKPEDSSSCPQFRTHPLVGYLLTLALLGFREWWLRTMGQVLGALGSRSGHWKSSQRSQEPSMALSQPLPQAQALCTGSKDWFL